MIPNKTFLAGMHIHQRDVFTAFDEGNTRFFVLEWARRHRKTTKAINLLIRECCRYPNAKYAYVAPTQVMAREIVWDDPTMLSSNLPDKSEMEWKLNEQKMIVKFANGSILKIGGSDKPDSLRGIDAIGVVLDEFALIKELTWTEIFRPIIAGPVPLHLKDTGAFRWAMFLFTPKGVNHATAMFDKAACVDEGFALPTCGKAEKMKPGWYASRIDAEEMGLMTSRELELAREDMPKILYDQELRCARITSEDMALITSELLNDLENIKWDQVRPAMIDMRLLVSVDPAFGGDACKIKGFENTRVVIDKTVLQRHKTHEVVFEIKKVAQELGTKNIIVDCIGNGKGVADALSVDEAEYDVQYFNSANRPTEQQSTRNIQFANKRAEAYYYTSERITLAKTEAIKNKELLRQLPYASKYKITNSGKLIIIPKIEIKAMLSCSPDEADCYVMGIWGLQYVDPVVEQEPIRDRYRDRESRIPDSAMIL